MTKLISMSKVRRAMLPVNAQRSTMISGWSQGNGRKGAEEKRRLRDSLHHELALVYRLREKRHAASETIRQTPLNMTNKRASPGEVSFSTRSLAGTFATSSIGMAKVKKALKRPRKAESGSREMLNRL